MSKPWEHVKMVSVHDGELSHAGYFRHDDIDF